MQSVSIEFSPSAKTFYPHETYFTIRFSVKTSEKITNKIFNENYLINISALRTHSIVSSYIVTYIDSYVGIHQFA